MLSLIIQIFFVCLLLVVGILTLAQKCNWWWLPFGKREVSGDTMRYTKLMGIITIIWGVALLLITIFGYINETRLSSWIPVLMLLIHSGFSIFGRIKFKIKFK